MKAIGFRAFPQGFHWAVVSGSRAEPILEDAQTVEAPPAFGDCEALKFLEDECRRILDDNVPTSAALREAEFFGKQGKQSVVTAGRKRCRVEGVIAASCGRIGLEAKPGTLVTISSNLSTPKAKELLDKDDLRGIDWSDYKKDLREAILVAVSGLK